MRLKSRIERLLYQQQRNVVRTSSIHSKEIIESYVKSKLGNITKSYSFYFFINDFDLVNSGVFKLKQSLTNKEIVLLNDLLNSAINSFLINKFKPTDLLLDVKDINDLLIQIEFNCGEFIKTDLSIFNSTIDSITSNYYKQIKQFLMDLKYKNIDLKTYKCLEDMREMSSSDIEKVVFPRGLISSNIVELIKLD